MLSESGLHMYFWAKIVNIMCYTYNRTLINKGHEKTPYHIMANKRPTMSYFHVVDGKYFVLIDGEHLGEFEANTHE